MATIEQRLEWLQQETNRWANGGWVDKKEILKKGRKLNARDFRRCEECNKKLDYFCKHRICQKCRLKSKKSMKLNLK